MATIQPKIGPIFQLVDQAWLQKPQPRHPNYLPIAYLPTAYCLVPIMFRFVWALDWYADVVCLFL